MKPTHPYLVEYNRFMDWFQTIHPALFDKYKKNFDLPLKRGGKVTVNNHYQINETDRQKLIEIAKHFYQQANNV